MKPEKIDKENSEFFGEILEDVEQGKTTIKDILGFEIEGAPVFIPRVPCARINPTAESCKASEANIGASSIFSLAPIYDTIIYPIDAGYKNAPINDKIFEEFNNISLNDFLFFVEKKRVIPYFPYKYGSYDEDFVKKFLEPGLPRISSSHLKLFSLKNMCNVVKGDCKLCDEHYKLANSDIQTLVKREDNSYDSCTSCLRALYSSGIKRESLLKSPQDPSIVCALKDVLISRNMDAVVKSNCKVAKDALGIFSGFTDIDHALDSIVRGLKVSYSPEIDIASYLQFLDGKTTKAIRQIIKNIMKDPYAMKYSERLNAKLCDLNKEIEEVGKTRTAKFYQAVSDIAVYGGSKYLESQSGSLIKPQKKDLHKTSEVIASKLFDIHAKATGKDWTIAQLYKTRSKIEKCKQTVK